MDQFSGGRSVQTSEDGRTWLSNTVRSMGIWGVESDSDEDYLRQLEAEEIESLKCVLDELGFAEAEIAAALTAANLPPSMGPTRVIVTVRGGVVQAVHSTDPDLDVAVLDLDAASENEEAAALSERLRAETTGMTEVL